MPLMMMMMMSRGKQGIDCGLPEMWLMLRPAQILPELMPDALHPNAAGMELLAQCLSPVVDELMAVQPARLQRRGLWPYG